jgi:hypothetical protein
LPPTYTPEIVDAVSPTPSTRSRPSSRNVDVFVAGAGTGGIAGVSQAIKKIRNPQCTAIAVELDFGIVLEDMLALQFYEVFGSSCQLSEFFGFKGMVPDFAKQTAQLVFADLAARSFALTFLSSCSSSKK